jgi:N-methylhydantoinase A
MYKITIDVGGTFTDAMVLDESGAIRQFKSPTTYPDPSIGFMDALALAAAAFGRDLPALVADVDVVIHGTTLATNALIDGSGAKVGMLTTRNFRDVLEIRRGHKNVHTSMYDVFLPPYKPLVPRSRRLEVAERVLYDGSVLEPLDEAEARAAAEQLEADGVEAVAVGFLHAYANPAHEQRAAEIAREVLGPDCYIVTSADILPMWREWERFSTTVLSAYLGPVVERYLTRLSERLAGAGFRGNLLMMLSDGLVGTLDYCTAKAVQMVRSGPAAAPAAALEAGAPLGRRDLMSIDMGGTSLDVCVITGGEVPMTRESWVEQERVATKLVDVHSVGAGGGSIAWLDSLGLLRVGPRSAGSSPGPAAYGKGGTEPTVTDADVLLGYLPVDTPLGGLIALQPDRARSAVETVAGPLGMDADEAAQAIFTTVNSFMADQITEVSTRRGHDVRDFTLVAGGGMGPLHGPFIAKLLGVDTVLVPGSAGTYSAFGMLAMDVGRTYIRTYVTRLTELDVAEVNRLYAEMEDEARAAFAPGEEIVLARTADVRYVGQFSEVEIEIPAGELGRADIDVAVERFHARHEELFTFNMEWKGVELLTLSLRATTPRAPLAVRDGRDAGSGEALKSRRDCWFEGDRVEADVYAGDRLAAGTVLDGPAIVEEQGTTMVVPPGFSCEADRAGGYVLRNRGAGAPLATAGAGRGERA